MQYSILFLYDLTDILNKTRDSQLFKPVNYVTLFLFYINLGNY